MKNLVIISIALFFCASVKADRWSDLEKKWTERARLMAEQARNRSIEIQRNEKLRQTDILNTLELIENGNPPANVKSNTTSLTTNISGKPITTKITIFSVGNDTVGAIHTVTTIYEESEKKDSSIKSYAWNPNGSTTTHVNGDRVSQSSRSGGSINYRA